jgi:uncharacterized membrane protein
MRYLQTISLLCIGGLLAITGIRQLLIDPLPDDTANATWFVIQTLPLLAVLPGMLRLNAISYFFAVIVAMLYFVHGVQASFGPAARGLNTWGMCEALLAVALVGFASYTIRALRAR